MTSLPPKSIARCLPACGYAPAERRGQDRATRLHHLDIKRRACANALFLVLLFWLFRLFPIESRKSYVDRFHWQVHAHLLFIPGQVQTKGTTAPWQFPCDGVLDARQISYRTTLHNISNTQYKTTFVLTTMEILSSKSVRTPRFLITRLAKLQKFKSESR